MLHIKLKKIGKKKIIDVYTEIDGDINTLRDLLISLVNAEVDKYNEKRNRPVLLPYLSPAEIQNQSATGKIGFGDIYNDKQANAELAVQNVLQAFKDGLFAVFIDKEEIKSLEQAVQLNPGSELMIIRLTFLTGSFW